jgi:hypothetical protein
MTQYHAIYRTPQGQLRPDWSAYDTLSAAMLGPADHPIVGQRLGHLERPYFWPPILIGMPLTSAVDLAHCNRISPDA